jgi:hypothetical protein
MKKLILTASLVALLPLMTAEVLAHPQKDGGLPPGLQKKLERGGELPPGWKKKLVRGAVLEAEIYRHGVIVVPLDDHGLVTISIEGELVRLIHATHEIVDILSHH